MILGRKITRFVIDEAHCFSAWRQDFRVDYLYIGDFIKSIQEKKNLEQGIPVSCFTATAKQNVIEDIRNYFKDKLNLDLALFSSKVARTNLHYKVIEKSTEEEKYTALRELIFEKECPTIVYVSRTRKAYELAERLTKDGLHAKPYHGKMDVKELNEDAMAHACQDVTARKIKTILNFWSIKHWIKYQKSLYSKNHFTILSLFAIEELKERLTKRHELSRFIVEFLYERMQLEQKGDDANKDEILVEFSVKELKNTFEEQLKLFDFDVTIEDIEDALFYLSRIDVIKIEG